MSFLFLLACGRNGHLPKFTIPHSTLNLAQRPQHRSLQRPFFLWDVFPQNLQFGVGSFFLSSLLRRDQTLDPILTHWKVWLTFPKLSPPPPFEEEFFFLSPLARVLISFSPLAVDRNPFP